MKKQPHNKSRKDAKDTRPFPLHPLLFAALPVLMLFHHNQGELRPGDLFLPLAVVMAASLLLWLALSKLLHNRINAALVSTLFWVWLFSYGHAQILLTSTEKAAGLTLDEAKLFLGIYSLVLAVGVVFFIRLRRGTKFLTRMLNFVALCLVAWNLVTIGFFESTRAAKQREIAAQRATEAALPGAPAAETLPNIYYIVLDGYARADVLQEIYGYDNTAFLSFLQDKGFFIADHARANYGQTMLSLASSLNLQYLDGLPEVMGAESTDRGPLWGMIADNRLFAFLHSAGYRIVGFPSIYRPTNLGTLDERIAAGRRTRLTDFQECILSTTPLVLLLRLSVNLDAPLDHPFDMLRDYAAAHRQRVLFPLDNLPDTARMEPPVFVFAHIISPHPPFVFDAKGGPLPGRIIVENPMADGEHFTGTPAEYIAGYRGQLTFINKKLEETISRLLAASYRPTVIILQADHGPGSRLHWNDPEKTYAKERFGILLAYYFSDTGDRPEYRELSPVNLFRVVLNEYFQTGIELLPNRSYYSPWDTPYKFTDVTDRVADGAGG